MSGKNFSKFTEKPHVVYNKHSVFSQVRIFRILQKWLIYLYGNCKVYI